VASPASKLAPMNNSPCITICFTDCFSKFYKIQLALNLTIINFEQKVRDEKGNPTLIMLSLLIHRIIFFAVLLYCNSINKTSQNNEKGGEIKIFDNANRIIG